MNKILVCLMVFALSAPIWSGEVEPIDNQKVTELLDQLPHKGFLTRGGNKSTILKVSEEYLDKIFPVLVEMYGPEGMTKGSSVVGSHISVNRPSIGEQPLGEIPELNTIIEFTPVRLVTVVPDLDPKWERVWIIEVHAPELEALRVANGLPPTVGDSGNEFHLTIATKLRADSSAPALNQ